MKKLSIACLCLLLQGCVGLAVGTYGTFEDEKTSVSISSKRNEFSYGVSTTTLTKETLISSWGEPDAIEKIGIAKLLHIMTVTAGLALVLLSSSSQFHLWCHQATKRTVSILLTASLCGSYLSMARSQAL